MHQRTTNRRFLIGILLVTFHLDFCSVYAQNATGKCESATGSIEKPEGNEPKVNITIPSEAPEISWFHNETYANLHAVDTQFALLCVASYPIQWIETYSQESDGFEMSEKTLWNERVTEEVTEGPTDYSEDEGSFRSSLLLKYRGAICSASNFTCQSVDNPCTQINALITLNKTTDVLTVQITHQPTLEDVKTTEKKECKGILSYWLNARKSGLTITGWKCETASGHIITENSEFSFCDSAAHCNTYFHHHRQGLECLKKVTTCFHCAYINPELYKPGFVTCRQKGVLLAQHYFYSVPQKAEESPKIYFSWDEAEPEQMLLLEKIPEDNYINDTITVYCQISRYYFAYGHRFALGYENGTVVYEEPTDGEFVELYNVNRMNTSIVLWDKSLSVIYCVAPIWNSTKWINQSAEIRIRTDPIEPIFNQREGPQEENEIHESVIMYHGQINQSLVCRASGRPAPTITWVNTVRGAKFVESSEDEKESFLIFPLVSHGIEGDYVCEIENFLGVKRKHFHVHVIEPQKIFIMGAMLLTTLVIVLCSIAMFCCWRKIMEQRNEIRLLTEAEIKEFREGNLDAVQSNDYLDTSDLIHSLPYNTKFEIPKEMIHIDETKILGSGNFGQVMKGSILVLDNLNGPVFKNALKGMSTIEVAVKRVKQNMGVLYFKTLLSEVKIMAYIGKHQNIVTLVGACTQNIRKREIYIAVEFCTHGSMEKFLRKYRKVFINLVHADSILTDNSSTSCSLPNSYENVEESDLEVAITTHHLVRWSREIANGMDFLGSKKIIHGDLACRNIFLTKHLVTKIGDFGLSRQLLEYSNYVTTEECPLPWKWISPEALQDKKFSVCSDVWAYGVTIWEIFTLANTPYPGVSWSLDFIDQLNYGMRMHKPYYATNRIYNIMLDCWALEPLARPSFPEIKNFFDRVLVNSSSQDYFDPLVQSQSQDINLESMAKDLNFVETKSKSLNTFGDNDDVKDENNLKLSTNKQASVDSVDDGLQDTQGYLIPLIEAHSPT